MSKHLFGIILTPHGVAANNRGETEGNITTLQKILWHGEQHTTVSAEAIRWAIRWFWQQKLGEGDLNRTWKEEGDKPGNNWKVPDFSGWLSDNEKHYMDDDILGFMSAEAAKAERNDSETVIPLEDGREIIFTATPDPDADDPDAPSSKIVYKLAGEGQVDADDTKLRLRFYAVATEVSDKEKQEMQDDLLKKAMKTVLNRFQGNEGPDEDKGLSQWDKALRQTKGKTTVLQKALNECVKPKSRPKGKAIIRRARLEVTRAVSLTPWNGELTFNAASIGATPSASRTGGNPVPYGTEIHATRYQYGFALTPESLHDKTNHAAPILDAIVALGNVGGNHARFLFDFSPETVVFRWTDDFAPRMLYGFGLDDDDKPSVSAIIGKVKAGDIAPGELVVGGVLSEESAQALKDVGVENVFPGVRKAAEKVKKLVQAN